MTEPNNFVEHFIDSSGVVSWRFFSSKADFDFVEWDFTADGDDANAQEAATLFGILEEMGRVTNSCQPSTPRVGFNLAAVT